MDKIPEQGVAREEVLAQLQEMGRQDVDWHGGKAWSLVYHAGDEHKQFLAEAHALFASANLLNPLAFKSLKKMESDVVRMSLDMLNAPEDAVGTMSSGGTESILLAVKAARERARRKRFWVRNPEMVVAETIHPAFDKAAHYFGIAIKRVPLDENYRVRVDLLKRAINRNTILIAASAPQYAHGQVDPIAEIGEIAQQRGLPFHVDACFGGFILPWMEALGHPVPTFDFRVPGVTSMSADIHKFGYASKGASVVLYRSMDYLKHQFFVETKSPLGIYASPTIMGTRPGGPVAAAWATLNALGREGYLELARRTMQAREDLLAGIRDIDGLEILGSEDGPIVTWASTDPSISTYAIADQLAERGWGVDRQQMPPSIHNTITANHVDAVAPYLEDIKESLEAVRANPDLSREGEAAMYGMMAKIPVRGAVKVGVMKVMESMYAPGDEEPDLGNLEGEDDGMLGALGSMTGVALDAFDKIDEAKDKVKSFLGRN